MSFGAILGSYRTEFLATYWQKKPLLIRRAFPGGLDYIDGDELAGLSCQEGVDARLVLEHGARPWQTRHGPFKESDFSALPPSHWTLLVQAVDRLVPSVSALRQQFRFLPNWRVDDIMISYAADQGSVGPHTDNYDVFLIQGQGRRRWDISAGPLDTIELEPGLDLKILRNFTSEQSFELEAGDMLYLPPRVAHHGVALGSCLTYSVGFRAPTRRDLMLSYAQFLLQNAEDEAEVFYEDPGLSERAEPGAIESRELEALWKLIDSGWQKPELYKRWIGGFLTEPRSFHEAAAEPLDADALTRLLRQPVRVRRTEGSRFSYYREGETLYFYAEGECVVLSSQLEKLAAYLCREEVYELLKIRPLGEDKDKLSRLPIEEGIDLLLHLWNQGFLREDDDG